jgi:hypothetical protein
MRWSIHSINWENKMTEIIFATYIISLIALATALYAVLELREIRKFLQTKRTPKSVVPQNTKKAKGHWD